MEELENWEEAGRIAHKVLGEAIDTLHVGMPLLELAERLEGEIRRLGGQPAFPVNISINEIAAHYSPRVGDDAVVPRGAVVKVDLGVHIEGCIADAAITVALDVGRESLVRAAKRALGRALAVMRPGVRLSEVGGVIERVVKSLGFKPIVNLSGHSMSKYSLHAGKSVPNVAVRWGGKARVGEVYAIEPFTTNGVGYVVEARYGYIYRVASIKTTGEKELDSMLRSLWSSYRGLPFSERWVYSSMGSEGLRVLKRLLRLRRVQVYPVLVEKAGGLVAQFEDTVVITREGVINTTRILDLV